MALAALAFGDMRAAVFCWAGAVIDSRAGLGGLRGRNSKNKSLLAFLSRQTCLSSYLYDIALAA